MFSWSRFPAVNKIIKILIWSDFLMLYAGGLLSPFFAVFVTGRIAGASLSTVGFAISIFFVAKAIAQVPVSWFADRTDGENDDYFILVLGSALGIAMPLLYFFATEVWHVYAIEAVNGVAHGMMSPTYLAIFSRHIDRHQESTEWMLRSNVVGLGYAVSTALGGLFAQRFGFQPLLLFMAGLMALGTLVLIFIRRDIKEKLLAAEVVNIDE